MNLGKVYCAFGGEFGEVYYDDKCDLDLRGQHWRAHMQFHANFEGKLVPKRGMQYARC
ncbi:MAG: hypothetical protein V3T40_07085 [Nitrososphaerales archaeon]